MDTTTITMDNVRDAGAQLLATAKSVSVVAALFVATNTVKAAQKTQSAAASLETKALLKGDALAAWLKEQAR